MSNQPIRVFVIFKLTSKETDKIYIGWMMRTNIRQALKEFQLSFKKYKSDPKQNFEEMYEILKYQDCQIKIVESIQLKGLYLEDLVWKMRYHTFQNKNICVNQKSFLVTDEDLKDDFNDKKIQDKFREKVKYEFDMFRQKFDTVFQDQETDMKKIEKRVVSMELKILNFNEQLQKIKSQLEKLKNE